MLKQRPTIFYSFLEVYSNKGLSAKAIYQELKPAFQNLKLFVRNSMKQQLVSHTAVFSKISLDVVHEFCEYVFWIHTALILFDLAILLNRNRIVQIDFE